MAIEASPDELDRIQHASERDYAMGNLERDSVRLREVRTALGRIRAGTFGVCAGREENISPKRLAAVPWALSSARRRRTAGEERSRVRSMNRSPWMPEKRLPKSEPGPVFERKV